MKKYIHYHLITDTDGKTIMQGFQFEYTPHRPYGRLFSIINLVECTNPNTVLSITADWEGRLIQTHPREQS